MRIADIATETEDRQLKSFDLAFRQKENEAAFFSRYRPGQFCQLSVFGKGEAPFGVAATDPNNGTLRFTINRIGVFTREIHSMKTGEAIGMRGPLGNGFPIDRWNGYDILIVGGGYAFTTLFALVRHILAPDNRARYGALTVLYGARSPGLFLYKPETEQWHRREDIRFHQTIDQAVDGWNRHVGLAPVILKKIVPPSTKSIAVVCGPPIMIRSTLPVLQETGFSDDRIFTSMEKRMKCGIGKCGRCNIGADYICADGPVFSLERLRQLPHDV